MSAPESPILHGGGLAAAARLYGGPVEDWLDLSTGINPCPQPLPPIPAAAWHRLPEGALVEAARAAARHYYKAENCLPLAAPGTQSVIQHLPKLADPARPVAVLGPTYGEYARVLRIAGLQVEEIETLHAVRDAHGLVVVVNPNNPTGRVFPRAELLSLAARLEKQGARLHVDEAFGDGEAGESLAADAGLLPGLTVFRSFGKFFGLAGLRLGFVLAEADVLSRFAEWLGPWPVSGPALSLAAHLMQADLSPLRDTIKMRHAAHRAVLEGAGLTLLGGTQLFTLVDHARAGALHAHLCRNHILVRKFDYNPRWLRIGLAPDDAADQRLAAALAGFSS